MAINPDASFSRGDLMRRLAALEAQVRGLQTARRLESASVGRGGIRVRGGRIVIEDEQGAETFIAATDGLTLQGLLQVIGGGTIRIQNAQGEDTFVASAESLILQGLLQVLGGDINVEDGGGVFVGDGGQVRVVGQGSVVVEQGGAIIVHHDNGTVGAVYGNLDHIGTGGAEDGHGLLVQADNGNDIFRAKQTDSGDKHVTAGFDLPFTPVKLVWLAGEDVQLRSGPGSIFLVPDNNAVVMQLANTTGTANMLVTGTSTGDLGQVFRISSSAADKVDVEDLRVDTGKVLRLRPRTWRDRGEVEQHPDTDRWYVGLVAEEVDATGLHEFVDYDRDAQPTSVAYDRLVIALLQVVQDQQVRLDALDGGGGVRPAVGGRKPKRVALPVTEPVAGPQSGPPPAGTVRRSEE